MRIIVLIYRQYSVVAYSWILNWIIKIGRIFHIYTNKIGLIDVKLLKTLLRAHILARYS